jgi:hypothetical protein
MSLEEVQADLRAAGVDPEALGLRTERFIERSAANAEGEASAIPPSSASAPDVAMACDASPRSSVRGGRRTVVVRLADRMRRATPMEMLSAAACFLFVILAGYALHRVAPPDVARPTDVDAGGAGPEAPQVEEKLEQARELWRQGREACDQGKWAECQGKLGKAAILDPKGNLTPEMKALWEKTYEGLKKDHPPGADKVPQGR